jgi:protein TonB
LSLEAQTIERIEKREPPPPQRSRFLAILGICLALHVGIFTLLIILDAIFVPHDNQLQETPVEVITEQPQQPPPPPPQPKPEEQQKQEPPPEQKKPEEKKPEEKKPEEQKPQEKPPEPKKPEPRQQQQQQPYEEPATDAPRAQNKEKVERTAPDKETKAARKGPATKQTAQKPSPEKQPSPAQQAAPDVSKEPPALKQVEDKPDAEVLERAEIKRDRPEEKETRSDTQGETRQGAKSVADELTDPDPAPAYLFSGAAKAAPVTGGTANTTYLSILWGLIIPGIKMPESASRDHVHREGVLVFNVDLKGNLTRVAVRQPSGLPELDAAAMDGLRKAAPFPPPPRGLTYSINFAYSNN